MAKRWKKRERQKPTLGDLFDVKVSEIKDKETMDALLYHMRTGNCPYNEKECKPENCPKGGMSNCPMYCFSQMRVF